MHYKAFKDADGGSKAELEALIEVCQSMHLVMPLNGSAPGSFISSELNPAELICTCKGFKISSNCSHEVAVTALFISDAQCVPGRTSFDKTYLENLVEKVAQVTRAAHIVLATCGLGPAFSRATTQSKRQGTERSLMKTWMACSGT